MKVLGGALLWIAIHAATAAAAPGTAGYQLYPVKGVFYARDGESLVNDEFRAADDHGAHFELAFRAAFPDAVSGIDDANKRRTFSVSLEVARASFYVVRKPIGTTDIYLPMTASVYFSNVLTGEILFAITRTSIPMGTVMQERLAEPGYLRQLYTRYFPQLVDELIAEVRARFHPVLVAASVAGAWNGLAILDAGSGAGLAADDNLVDDRGDELRVLSVGASHAVARLELGRFDRGDRFSRVTSKTLAEVRRPRVLPVIDQSPAELPREAVLQLFSDALGASAPIAVVPVNRSFADVLHAVAAQAQFTQDEVRQRALPAFFVRLHVLDPISFEIPTPFEHKRRRVTEGIAFAEVVDASGRVLFVAQGLDRIEDEIVEGIGLREANRREIVTKNALVALAKKFGAGLHIRSAELPILSISATGSEIVVRDDSGMLALAGNARVYRNIGRVGAIREDVHVPLVDVEVTATEPGRFRARPLLPVVAGAPRPAPGDVVLLDGIAGARATRLRLGSCGNAERLGAVEVNDYEALAANLFNAGYSAPFYSIGLGALINGLVSEGCGFKADIALVEPPIDYCIQPVYRIDLEPPQCSSDGCADVAQLKLTYRIRAGALGQIKARRALGTRMVATTLPVATVQTARAASLRRDLLEEVIELAPKVAHELVQDRF